MQYVGTFEVGVGKVDKQFVKDGIRTMKVCALWIISFLLLFVVGIYFFVCLFL